MPSHILYWHRCLSVLSEMEHPIQSMRVDTAASPPLAAALAVCSLCDNMYAEEWSTKLYAFLML